MKSPFSQRRLRKEHLWGIRPFKRHGLVLMVAGLIYILIGITYVFTEPTKNHREALQIALRWFPIYGWGIVFIVIGVLVMISARWPPVSDSWGYALLTGLSAGWAATYASGVIFEDSPIINLTWAFTWGLLAFLWVAISGFVNPDKTVVVVVKDDGSSTDS